MAARCGPAWGVDVDLDRGTETRVRSKAFKRTNKNRSRRDRFAAVVVSIRFRRGARARPLSRWQVRRGLPKFSGGSEETSRFRGEGQNAVRRRSSRLQATRLQQGGGSFQSGSANEGQRSSGKQSLQHGTDVGRARGHDQVRRRGAERFDERSNAL